MGNVSLLMAGSSNAYDAKRHAQSAMANLEVTLATSANIEERIRCAHAAVHELDQALRCAQESVRLLTLAE